MKDITVCIGSSCHLRGSREVVQALDRLVREAGLQEEINLRGSFCMGACEQGVCVTFEGARYSLSPGTAEAFFRDTVLPALGAQGGKA